MVNSFLKPALQASSHDYLLGTNYKKDDFEKVQGLVVPDTHSKELRKYKKRDDQHEYDYIEPLNLVKCLQ